MASTAPATEVARPVDRRRLVPLLLALATGLLLAELDQTVFATALPTIVGELNGVEAMLWVNTAYLAAGTVVMPVYGKLGDLLGRRPMFLAALAIFLVGSVIGGLAPSMGWLIAGRAVQGLGGGGLLILIQAIVADLIPARQRAPYLAGIGAVFAVAALVGPVLGGWLTDSIGWRWAFWINLPLGGLAIAAGAALLPRPRRPARVVVDVAGVAALAVAVTAVVLVASWGGTTYGWGSPVILGLALAAVGAVAVLVRVERRAVEPVLPPSLFADRTVVAAITAGGLTAVAMFGTIGYLPSYLQMGYGLGATEAGLWMLTLMAGLGLATVAAARIVSRTGRAKPLPVIGCGLVGVALALLSTLTPATDLRLVGAYLFVLGAGIGCGLEILVLIVQNAAPPAQVGVATATNAFFREIGVSLGTAVVGTVFTARLGSALAARLPVGIDPNGLGPAELRGLPVSLQAAVESAYTDALTPVFAALVPLMGISVVLLLTIRSVRLASTLAASTPVSDRPS